MARKAHMKEVVEKRPGEPDKIAYYPRMRLVTKVKDKATGAESWVEIVDPATQEECIHYIVAAQKAKLDDFGNVLRPAVEPQSAPTRRNVPAYCEEGEEPTLLKLDGSVVPWTRG